MQEGSSQSIVVNYPKRCKCLHHRKFTFIIIIAFHGCSYYPTSDYKIQNHLKIIIFISKKKINTSTCKKHKRYLHSLENTYIICIPNFPSICLHSNFSKATQERMRNQIGSRPPILSSYITSSIPRFPHHVLPAHF